MAQDESLHQIPSEHKTAINILTSVEAEDKDSSSEETLAETAPIEDAKNGKPNYEMSKTKVLLVFIGLSLAIFLAALDQTIVATALPAIALEFKSLDEVAWIGTAYLLAA
ncbi:5933_t:CDS:2, partial [Racocetra persica]